MPTLAVNKKARFDYEILETFEAGIVLSGQEVKAAKAGQVSLTSAYVVADSQRNLSLINAAISPYKMAGPLPNYDPGRSRRLLLHRKEIDYLAGKIQQSGLTLVPLSLYTKHNKIKLEIGLARGKKKYDKRQTIRKRDDQRQINRILKNNQ
ncbi:MAG: SsrA-binding protein [Candidatus Buchananbacteria bacterium RBG_13_36_9]|jgi:SsrA-binding protein|uniref:SsrA-binding protein n=1 Tax=Candidatus Buchananbacteria bacterium RBG_13_36_9 TaxID=1797530 RepID=A0A1G1XQ75_9BACT|nr:MAG: SsrA-binding protein [Candidatus Buchananbacteria bacterium RBG_13_36_9]